MRGCGRKRAIVHRARNVGLHIRNMQYGRELSQAATLKEYLIVKTEGYRIKFSIKVCLEI